MPTRAFPIWALGALFGHLMNLWAISLLDQSVVSFYLVLATISAALVPASVAVEEAVSIPARSDGDLAAWAPDGSSTRHSKAVGQDEALEETVRMNEAFTIAAAVNNEDILKKNLLLSPGLLDGGRNQLVVKRGFASASLAYNSAIDDAEHDVIIFVHQDIYLPETWFADLRRCLAQLDAEGARWGVLGCFGSRRNAEGGLGRVYTRGLGKHGNPLARPEPIETLDEIVLVLRKSSGLRFDPDLPHFHLYGTDICMTARDRGIANYAFQGFCVHNTHQLLSLPKEFYSCYHYIRRKWAKYLPIYASCMKISLLNEELYRKRIFETRQRLLGKRRQVLTRVDDPREFAHDRD